MDEETIDLIYNPYYISGVIVALLLNIAVYIKLRLINEKELTIGELLLNLMSSIFSWSMVLVLIFVLLTSDDK